MKKITVAACLFTFVAFFSACKKEVCIRCTPIVPENGSEQRFCSKDKDERATFMVKWIKDGYNCRED